MKDILSKLRKYEIRIRKAINTQMRGNYHSIFKGSGLEFDDVRNYQYGDDVRRIDWNVSAKGDGTFVKVFKEEKEQTVFFLVDVSASQEIGQKDYNKIKLSKEIAGVLMLAATKENSHVGMICFSDQKELYMRPKKSQKHAYEMIHKLYKLQPQSRGTNLDEFIRFSLNIIKRRSIIILISDFIDEDKYLHDLKGLGEKHDLVLIHIHDLIEQSLPSLGIVPLYDKESNTTYWQNTSSRAFKKDLAYCFEHNQSTLQEISKRLNINYLPVRTDEDFIPALIRLFKFRNRGR